MARTDLYEAVYQKVGLSRTKSSALVALVLKEITECLEKGETVKLASFGSFMVAAKVKRLERNPKTGVKARIPHIVPLYSIQAVRHFETTDQPSDIGRAGVAAAKIDTLIMSHGRFDYPFEMRTSRRSGPDNAAWRSPTALLSGRGTCGLRSLRPLRRRARAIPRWRQA
jgi:integration host factor subunit alpha